LKKRLIILQHLSKQDIGQAVPQRIFEKLRHSIAPDLSPASVPLDLKRKFLTRSSLQSVYIPVRVQVGQKKKKKKKKKTTYAAELTH
jgi:hypothetical protein